jgi:hypothetical protein
MVAMNRCGNNNDEPPRYDDGYGDDGEDHFIGMIDNGSESYVDGFVDGCDERRKTTYIIGGSLFTAGLGFGMVVGMVIGLLMR